MVQEAIAQFGRASDCEAIHLPFFFTLDVRSARKGGWAKAIELAKVIGRLLRIRLDGAIDLFLFPVGGPQTVPMIRDLFLLPWVLLTSRRVILHFHAAGIADRLETDPGFLPRLLAIIYQRAYAAVVMTRFNQRDPLAIGIKRIIVLPHRIKDEFDPELLRRGQGGNVRLLYIGHLCSDKGTPQLLEAFAELCRNHPDRGLELELVGECLPPFAPEQLDALIDNLGIRSNVRILGVLTGRMKAEAFGRADLFVFPSVAPYESFGLVLVEAMAWRLPIVASRWRGNCDVLTDRAGGILFPVSSPLAKAIKAALEEALQQRNQIGNSGVKRTGLFSRTDTGRTRRKNGWRDRCSVLSALWLNPRTAPRDPAPVGS